MSIPSYEKLYAATLEITEQETSIKNAVQFLSDKLNLSAEDRAKTVPSGRNTVIRSRVTWAVTYLVQAGLLERPKRGHFRITAEGTKVLANPPEQIDNNFLRTYPAFVDFLSRGNSKTQPQPATSVSAHSTDERSPEEVIGEAYEVMESDTRRQVLARILQNSPEFFENLVVKLLSGLGYGSDATLAKAVGAAGDGGIDGIIYQDRLGLDVVYIQAKRYASGNAVGRPELQAFVGTLAGVSAQKGVFVTTSHFTSGAMDYLNTVNARVITIDGSRLVELMLESGVGVRTSRVFELHRLDEDFFLEE